MLHLKKSPLGNGISEFIPPTPPEKHVERRRRVERVGGGSEEHPIGAVERRGEEVEEEKGPREHGEGQRERKRE